MVQLTLFRDYGKQRALANEYLIVPDQIRDNNAYFNRVLEFTIHEIPQLLHGSFDIVSFNKRRISPYQFKKDSFRKTNTDKIVFNTRKELINSLDLDLMKKILEKKYLELIGIDESKIEYPLQFSVYAYLKSITFRMYVLDNEQKEEVGPLVQKIRVRFRDDEKFQKENQFWGYISNIYIALLAIMNSITSRYKPIVFIHGPLVRAIGGFTDIHLSYEDAKQLLSVNEEAFEGLSLSQDVLELMDGDKNLEVFHQTEIDHYNDIYGSYKHWSEKLKKDWKKSLPIDIETGIPKKRQERSYPGLNLYLWLISKLYDLCERNKVPLVGIVEDISSSTEFVKYVLPSLFIKNSSLIPKEIKDILHLNFDLRFPSKRAVDFNSRLYKYIFEMIDKLNISDSIVFTYLLNEGECTAPVQIYRYTYRSFFEHNLGHSYYGIDNSYKPIVDFYLNHNKKRILMSYVRTTQLREPIRVEFFDVYDDYKPLLGTVYLLSLFYEDYGIPVILYYVDKIARTPKLLIKIIVESEVLKIMIGSGQFNVEDYHRVIGKFSRNFFRR